MTLQASIRHAMRKAPRTELDEREILDLLDAPSMRVVTRKVRTEPNMNAEELARIVGQEYRQKRGGSRWRAVRVVLALGLGLAAFAALMIKYNQGANNASGVQGVNREDRSEEQFKAVRDICEKVENIEGDRGILLLWQAEHPSFRPLCLEPRGG